MGGKGRRRREKNYLAAHGGNARLPPPPKLKELEELPSKLRLLMKFKSASSDKNPEGQVREGDGRSEKKKPKAAVGNVKGNNRKEAGLQKGPVEKSVLSKQKLQKDEISDANINSDSDDVKEKKRKRKAPKDLRFENLDAAATDTRKKKRKEYLDAKKKKQRKDKEGDDVQNFPGREKIKFGEVVQAPPKLTLPKLRKSSVDASKEHLRLQAIEEYRNRKGWTNRLGIQLPTVDAPTLQ